MALDDVPLEDAGRDYYAKQFGDRVRNIRKYGSPPRNTGGRGSRWGAIGGVVALLFVIRILVAVATLGGGASSSSYNNYNTYQPPAHWNDNMQAEPQPWRDQTPPPPILQPDERMFPPNPPVILDPIPPPQTPDGNDKAPDKDD